MLLRERMAAAAGAAAGADPIGVTAFMALCAPLASLAHNCPPPLRSTRRGRKTAEDCRLRRLVARLRPLRPAGVGLYIALRRALDQRLDLLLDRLDRGVHRIPLGPVPLDERNAAVAVVVGAAQLHR